jgi:hypothetical protein
VGDRISEASVHRSLERLAGICHDLPECEITGDQHHKVSVAGKTMGWHAVDHHGDGRISLSLRAPKGENEVLVASDPDTFFMPPYMAHHGYVGVYLDRPTVDWEEVRELVTDAYVIAAPKRLSRMLS